jgi:hypothetical protein
LERDPELEAIKVTHIARHVQGVVWCADRFMCDRLVLTTKIANFLFHSCFSTRVLLVCTVLAWFLFVMYFLAFQAFSQSKVGTARSGGKWDYFLSQRLDL